MDSVKMTVVLDGQVADELRRRVPARRRSAFIASAIRREFRQQREEELARAYREAYGESEAENREMEGTAGDGID